MLRTLKRLGTAAPKSIAEMSKLRQRLVTAGYRGSEALIVFFGIRLACALTAFALLATPLIVRPSLFKALAGCFFAYLVPSMLLARMAKRRQHRIRLGLP